MGFARTKDEQQVTTLAPEATALDAARVMAREHKGAVVVARAGKPVGIVTDRDIAVRVVAARLDPASTSLESIMSRPLVTASEDTAPVDAAVIMAQRGVRRLPLVDAEGALTGLLALDDLISIHAHGLGCLARAVAQEQRREALSVETARG